MPVLSYATAVTAPILISLAALSWSTSDFQKLLVPAQVLAVLLVRAALCMAGRSACRAPACPTPMELAERARQLETATPGTFPHHEIVRDYLYPRKLSRDAGSGSARDIWAACLAFHAKRHLLGVLPAATVWKKADPCLICFDNMNGKLARRLNCTRRHTFHKACIDRWAISCPICKQPPM